MYEPDRRYHLHCDGCGLVTYHPRPVLATRCPRCGANRACTDMDTGHDTSRSLEDQQIGADGQWHTTSSA